MSKKILFLLLVFTILLGGCTSTKTAANKSGDPKDPVTLSSNKNSAAASGSNETQAVTIPAASSTKAPPLTPTEKAKLKDKTSGLVTSIDGALNALDEAKDLDLDLN